ncbi:hypothetical protein GOV11_03310 [Candidatus Woesearchaeota archaeon]|nr:hypothetical protein [Candidatus Woesearchaeota archaeon]
MESREILNGQEILPEYIPKIQAYYDELRTLDLHKKLEQERQQVRVKTIVSEDLINKAYEIAVEYGKSTFDGTRVKGDEYKCGGLLILIGNWNEPGISKPYADCDGGELPKQISYEQEHYLNTDEFNQGISLVDENLPGLDSLLEHYVENPHHNMNDLAIFVNHEDGQVTATHAHVEGVRSSEIPPEPSGYTGGSRFKAGRHFAQKNPYAVSIMVSAGEAAVYLMQQSYQHGQPVSMIKRVHNIETGEDTILENLITM